MLNLLSLSDRKLIEGKKLLNLLYQTDHNNNIYPFHRAIPLLNENLIIKVS